LPKAREGGENSLVKNGKKEDSAKQKERKGGRLPPKGGGEFCRRRLTEGQNLPKGESTLYVRQGHKICKIGIARKTGG